MKSWRDSASLILAARQVHKRNLALPGSTQFQYDYKVLNLKRHRNASFMPEAYVFPGGTVEPSDADLKWNKLFSAFGFDAASFKSLFAKSSKRPPIFKQRRNELPREISLRITAIRETFEESGILLCKKAGEKNSLSEWAEHAALDDLKNWQTRIHDDSTEFYKMCERFGYYPNIWALHEWSNWLTPTCFPKRFDTIFYLACVPSQPPTDLERKEMEDLKWEDPNALLCPSNGYKLEPPQQYELARIAKFESLNNLLDFAMVRSKIGVRQNFPVRIRLSDGQVHVLPGDCMYPDNVSLTERQELDRTSMTVAEFRDESPVKNRFEYYSLDVRNLAVDNFESIDGHLSPLSIDTVQIKSTKQ